MNKKNDKTGKTEKTKKMFDAQIIPGERSDEYYRKVTDLWTTYNAVALYPSSPTINYPEKTAIVYIRGVAGGLFLTQHDEGFWRLMLAVFPPKDQRQGYLRGCLAAADQAGMDVQMVEVDFGDQNGVWGKLGFTEKGMVNLTPIVFKPGMKEKYNLESRNTGDGLPLDDVLSMLAAYHKD